MKFKISREHFVNGLQKVRNLVGSRATMPILGHVLIEADNDRISLTTTNLDLGIRCSIRANVEQMGSITVPVHKLATIIGAMPLSEVSFETASGNQAKLGSGGSKFRIMGISKDEFPPLPSFEDQHSINLDQSELVQMLKSVSYAQSTDENRYILNGVYFHVSEGKLTLVATDGRRLAHISRDMEVSDENEGSLILPAKTVRELERVLNQNGKVCIAFNERQVAFEITVDEEKEEDGLLDTIYLVSKIVEGNYPNYRQVIPKETVHRIKVERELLFDCVHRAAMMTSDKNNAVKIKISNNLLEVLASSSEYGESHETMAVAFDGPEVTIAINPEFMMDPLKALSNDEVFFEFKDELSPGVFKTLESFMCVIMPLRLN